MMRFFEWKFIKNEDGITLLEMLLVVGIFGAVSLFVMELSNTWAKQQRAERIGDHLMTVQAAAEDYLLDNFAQVRDNLVPAVGDTAVIPIEDDGGGFFLKENNTYLPVGFSDENLFGQQLRLLIRREDVERIQGIVVSTGRAVAFEEVLQVIQAAGNDAGAVVGQNMGGYFSANFSGLGGAWSVPIANYAATGWNVANLVTPSTAHLAALVEVNLNNTNLGDYLYRVDVGDEDANRMSVNLDMNNNAIDGIGTASADFMDINGNLTVNEVSFVVSEGMVVEGNLTANSVDVGGMSDPETASLNLTSMITTGDVNAMGDINVTNNLAGNGFDASSPNHTSLTAVTARVSSSVFGNTFVGDSLQFSGANPAFQISNTSNSNVAVVTNTQLLDTPALGVAALSDVQNLTVTGNAIEIRQASELTGSIAFGGEVSDAGATRGDFDNNNAFPGVDLNVNIGARTGCDTATNGICN